MKWRDEAAGYAVGLVVVVVFAVGFAGDSVGHKRARVSGSPQNSAPVLVAKKLIPKGTPGLIVATTNGMWAPTTLPINEVEDGALADPAYLNGRVSVADILPGQQLTVSDFTGG